MSGRRAGSVGAGFVALGVLVGCTVEPSPALPSPTLEAGVRRTATEILFEIPGWSTNGAQIYLCPTSTTIDPDPVRLLADATAARCLDAGIGPVDRGITGIGVPFLSVTGADRVIFDAAPHWYLVVVERPVPPDRAPLSLQREVAGGPIEP